MPGTTAVPIDQVARENAEAKLSQLTEKIGEAEIIRAWLGGFVEPQTLAGAAIGSSGIKAREIQERIPTIRQAIRDLDPGYPEAG